jgi:hypothetical protein
MAEETEMKTLTCPGPPEHEFKIPKGRGRPPKYCDDHKAKNSTKEEKVTDSEKTRARPRPGGSGENEDKQETRSRPGPPGKRPAPRVTPDAKGPLDQSSDEGEKASTTDEGLRKMPPVGNADTQSRVKAEKAAKRTNEHVESVDTGAWPRGADGRPMAKITMTASELVPTGQYANVSVGPAQITAFVDLSRSGEIYFDEGERQVLISAMNELAEVVERDVIAVQRNLVLESIQEQIVSNGKS